MFVEFYQEESALVEEIRAVIIEAAQECIPLWYRVWMDSEFIVEEAEITNVRFTIILTLLSFMSTLLIENLAIKEK